MGILNLKFVFLWNFVLVSELFRVVVNNVWVVWIGMCELVL